MFVTILTEIPRGIIPSCRYNSTAVATDGLHYTWRENKWLFIMFLTGNNDFLLAFLSIGISLRLPILLEKNKQNLVS